VPCVTDGLVTVMEGQRIHLRVYRRFFFPVHKMINGIPLTVYRDTGRELEISYSGADEYELDNPFNRMKLIRLARAMNCIKCSDTPTGSKECIVVICRNKDLYDPDSEEVTWVPFDPGRLKSFDARLREHYQRKSWQIRMNT